MGACLTSSNKSPSTSSNKSTNDDVCRSMGFRNESTRTNERTKQCKLFIRDRFKPLDLNTTNYIDELNYLTDICSGKEFTIYCNHNNQKYYVAGNYNKGSCGIDKVTIKTDDGIIVESAIEKYVPFTSINFFKDNNIKIKKVCTNINSESVFWITNSKNVYGHGGSHSKLGMNSIDNQWRISTPYLIETLHNAIDITSHSGNSVALCKLDIDTLINGFLHDYDIVHDVINLIKGFFGYSGPKIYATEVSGYPKNQWNHIEMWDDKDIIKIDSRRGRFYLLQSNGILLSWCIILNELQPIQYFIDNDIKIRDIACGEEHMLAVDDNGKLYSLGDDHYGQCATDNTGSSSYKKIYRNPQLIKRLAYYKIITIKCGSNHSYAMTDTGKHFFWGNNNREQCVSKDNRGQRYTTIVDRPRQLDIGANKIKHISLGVENTKIIFAKPLIYLNETINM